MKIKPRAFTAAALLAVACHSVHAGEKVGYNATTVPAGSDALLTVPFSQTAEGEYSVVSISGSTLTVADALQADAFAGTHYVRVLSGEGEGLWSTIVSNTTAAITIENAAVAAEISAGNTFRVCPHHTLDSLFPKEMLGKFFKEGTNVLIYENDLSAMAQNKSATKTAVYSTAAGGWFGADVSGDTILAPETRFVLRNNDAEALTMITYGDVPDFSVSMLLAADGDLVVGSGYPLPVSLENSGLGKDGRTVLFYDNAAAGQNKSADKTAVYVNDATGWFGDGKGEDILPSAAITLRLPAGETETKVTIQKPY